MDHRTTFWQGIEWDNPIKFKTIDLQDGLILFSLMSQTHLEVPYVKTYLRSYCTRSVDDMIYYKFLVLDGIYVSSDFFEEVCPLSKKNGKTFTTRLFSHFF